MRKLQVVAFALVVTFCPALAWGYDGTQAEQDACTQDVFNLCSAFIPNEAPILACLQSHKANLSAACSQVLFPRTTRTRRAKR